MSAYAEWGQEQMDLITAHPNWSDHDLAVALSQIGPMRTPKAVEARRKVMGVRRARVKGKPSQWHAAMRAANERLQGWPSVPSTYEAQDRKHVEDMRRAREARSVSA